MVHILLFHKIRNTTELLKDPNVLECDNKHDTNWWVNLSVILIILVACVKIFLSRVVQKKWKNLSATCLWGLLDPFRGSRLWTVSWWLTNCTCGWLHFPGWWWWSRDWCGYLDGCGTVWIGIFVSGLRCDLVRQYTPSEVLFLTMYDRGSFASLKTVSGSQVLACWSGIRTGWPGGSGSRVEEGWACFPVIIETIAVLNCSLTGPEPAWKLVRLLRTFWLYLKIGLCLHNLRQ